MQLFFYTGSKNALGSEKSEIVFESFLLSYTFLFYYFVGQIHWQK